MRFVLLLLSLLGHFAIQAQKVESIHFNLYTDSLKKGTHNYINVDGKMSDGGWKPLTAKELNFQTDYGTFEGNDLVLPQNTKVDKVTISVSLKSDAKKTKQVTIWIKQKPDPPLQVESNNPRKRYR